MIERVGCYTYTHTHIYIYRYRYIYIDTANLFVSFSISDSNRKKIWSLSLSFFPSMVVVSEERGVEPVAHCMSCGGVL